MRHAGADTAQRIGVDAHILSGKYQGTQTYLANMLREIGNIDRTNLYLIYSYDPDAAQRLLPHVNFIHMRLPDVGRTTRLLLTWPFIQLRDNLHFLLSQYVSPFFFSKRQIVVIHDILFESHPEFFPSKQRLLLKTMTSLSAKRARAIFVVSDFTQQEVLKRYVLPPSKVHLTYNGFTPCRPNSSAPPRDQPQGRYILFVGRLERRKNVACLLRAFRKLRRTGLSLVIVGREDFDYGEILKEMSNTPKVVHLRDVSAEDLAQLYQNASVFAFPSYAEGFGLPILEALGYGIPVVSSNQTAMPEVGGSLVRYFDPTSVDAEDVLCSLLAEALDRPWAADPEAVRTHLSRFDWAASARTVVDTLDRLRSNLQMGLHDRQR